MSLQNKFLISFDVTSLFTNIPLEETIKLAVDVIIEKDRDNKFSREQLTKLFEFATLRTNSSFEGEMYDQTDGVAMGSPLAPILANLFMGFYEQRWLGSYLGEKPLLYRRYVDDIFCVFDDKEQALSFYEYINSKHPNIKFTFEEQVKGKLPFLDIMIDANESTVITSVFHKPTQ